MRTHTTVPRLTYKHNNARGKSTTTITHTHTCIPTLIVISSMASPSFLLHLPLFE